MSEKDLFIKLLMRYPCESCYLSVFIHSAPLIKRLKASHIINVRQEYVSMIIKIYEGFGIEGKVLDRAGDKGVLLLYRKRELEEYLLGKECISLLRRLGYRENELEGLLKRFSRRMKDYRRINGSFPHEMGLFLEYPVKDVEAFIKNQGEAFLFCGYWKVYTSPGEAKKRFEQYDAAKDELVRMLSGAG